MFVDIFNSANDKLIAEFFSIGSAAAFIVDVANNRLGRSLKKNYIKTFIGCEPRGVMKGLGFRSVCSFMCDHCGYKISGRPAFYDPEGMRRNLCKGCHSNIERNVNDY